jgi:hypothetical protein
VPTYEDQVVPLGVPIGDGLTIDMSTRTMSTITARIPESWQLRIWLAGGPLRIDVQRTETLGKLRGRIAEKLQLTTVTLMVGSFHVGRDVDDMTVEKTGLFHRRRDVTLKLDG